jgi:hypothetical protein
MSTVDQIAASQALKDLHQAIVNLPFDDAPFWEHTSNPEREARRKAVTKALGAAERVLGY